MKIEKKLQVALDASVKKHLNELSANFANAARNLGVTKEFQIIKKFNNGSVINVLVEPDIYNVVTRTSIDEYKVGKEKKILSERSPATLLQRIDEISFVAQLDDVLILVGIADFELENAKS